MGSMGDPWVDLIDLLGASREIRLCYLLLAAATRSPVFQLIFWCHVQELLLANLVPNMAQLGIQNAPKWCLVDTPEPSKNQKALIMKIVTTMGRNSSF